MKNKTVKFWVCISLVICLISAFGASLIQTNFGDVTVKDLRWETESGHMMSALLFVPKNATKESPAPAIVCTHGWYNNREMQDLNFVEYARRGFVVISIDMYGHGNSDDVKSNTWFNPENNANGVYDAVKLIADLPYVDDSRIGVTGHSNGALASRFAVLMDNEAKKPLIAAALLVSNDAVYNDKDGNYINMFGSRDAGIVACQYDEFFHRVPTSDGFWTAPRDYINQVTAQSFLNFGKDPKGLEHKDSYKLYKENIDGKEAIRAIFNPEIIHPWAHFSGRVVSSSVEFFDASLNSPIKIAPNNQIWQWKAFFNALGLLGFVMFMVNITLLLLKARAFETLAVKGEVLPAKAPEGKAKAWFWLSGALGAVFSFVVYMFGYGPINKLYAPLSPFFPQSPVFFIGVWTLLCGLFTLVLILVGKKIFKVEPLADEKKISIKKLGLTVVLALTVVVLSYSLVFAADFFFKTDFRLWVIPLKAFSVSKLPVILKYVAFFLVFYILNSVSINRYNYFEMGKNGKDNTWVMMLINAFAPAAMIATMYITFRVSGHLPNEFNPSFGGSIIGIWLFPVVVMLPLAAWISRKIYKATENPYIAPIIFATIVTIISCVNSLTVI